MNPCLRYGTQSDEEVLLSYYLLLGKRQPFPSKTAVLESVWLSLPCLIRG